MALDFLSSPSSWANPDTGQTVPISSGSGDIKDISNLLNLIGAGVGTANTFKGYQPTSAATGQNQAMANQGALLKALIDPNNAIYKNIVAGNQQQLNNQTQMGISNLLAANRKAQVMGRQTFFNPERQDEAVSQYLSKQSDANAGTSRSNALQQILAAANGYGLQAGNYGRMIPQQQQAQNQNNSALPAGLSQIGQMLPMLMQAGAMFA